MLGLQFLTIAIYLMCAVGDPWGQTKRIQRKNLNNYGKRMDALSYYAKVVLITD